MLNKLLLLIILCSSIISFADIRVVSHYPSTKMHDVPVILLIYVNFNHEIDPLSINDYSVSLSNGEYEVPGKVSYLPALKRLTFKPSESLEKGNSYIFRVFSGLQALNGEVLNNDIIFQFDTGQKKDLVLPQIVDSIPKNASKDISPNTSISLTFSKPISAKSIKNAIKLIGGSKTLPIKVNYIPKKYLLKINPLKNFEYSRDYKVILSSSLKDLSGNHLSKDYVLEFTIMDEPDTTPPEILASLPKNRELEASTTSEILIKISELIDTSTISPENIKLLKDNKEIPTKINYNPMISEITIKSDKQLDFDSNYQLVVENICDTSGNKMKKHIIKFKTHVMIDKKPPEIIEIIPKNNTTDVPIDSTISIMFSEPISTDSLSESILLSDDKKIIKTALNYDKSRKVISVKPINALLKDHHYRLVIKRDITDLFGNRMRKGKSTDFITEKLVIKEAQKLASNPPINNDAILNSTLSDITGVPLTSPLDKIKKVLPPKDSIIPKVIDYFPMKDFSGVALDCRISFIFNKQLDEKTLTPSNIRISQLNRDYKFTIIYDYEYKRLTLTPKSTFYPKKPVTVYLLKGIKDKSGNSLKEFNYSFTTGDSLDSEIEISLKKNDIPKPKVTKKTVNKDKNIPDIDFYSNDNIKQNFTREEWAQYLVQKLQRIFDPDYSVKASNGLLKPTRYELAMILTHILKKYYNGKNSYLFSSKKGIAKLLLLEQAVIEFKKELSIMGTNTNKFEERLKKRGIPVDQIKEDMDNGIIKGKQ